MKCASEFDKSDSDDCCSLLSFVSGVKPEGNVFFDRKCNQLRSKGLGAFSVLSDAQVMDVLEFLCPVSLTRVMQTSKTFYAFCSAEDLWMQFVVSDYSKTGFTFRGGCWRATYVSLQNRQLTTLKNSGGVPLPVTGLYSDLLFHRNLYATVRLKKRWLKRESIPRIDGTQIAHDAFIDTYVIPGRPVILTGIADQWPAVKRWSRDYLLRVVPNNALFEAGCANMTLRDFFHYASTNHDEAPLCLFDPNFGEVAPPLLEDYGPPSFFQNDLFSLLKNRPNFRWILLGNYKSGSKWHVDPNCTHAWNGVIKGAKRWMLLPPNTPPPGVFPSQDKANVVQPLSLVEWYMNFYDAAASGAAGAPLMEGTCRAGDIMFVPREWWHAVINLEDDTFAITQNCVTAEICQNVRSFLKCRPDCVSGVSAERKHTLWKEFDDALGRHCPELLSHNKNPALPPLGGSLELKWASTGTGCAAETDDAQNSSNSASSSFWDQLRAKKQRILITKTT